MAVNLSLKNVGHVSCIKTDNKKQYATFAIIVHSYLKFLFSFETVRDCFLRNSKEIMKRLGRISLI